MATVVLFPRPILVSPALTADTFSSDSEGFSFVLKFEDVVVNGTAKSIRSFNVDFPEVGVQKTIEVKDKVNATYTPAVGSALGYWTVTGSIPIPAQRGAYKVTFNGQDTLVRPGGVFTGPIPETINTSASTTITLVAADSIDGYRAVPPAGVKVLRQRDYCRVEWNTPEDDGLMGVRVMVSTDYSGVDIPYEQFGDLVKVVTRVATEVVETATKTQIEDLEKTTTVVESRQKVNISSVDIPAAAFSNTDVFYVALSTVILDPATNHIYESEQIGPIQCGFVDLRKVTPADFPASQQQSDIAARMISNLTTLYPDLDLSPRSEMRDLFIDPVSIELANSSVREWFARVSSSISALTQLDDADGDGFSDPVESSMLKQILQRAFGLDSTALQKLIDRQFDVLGEQAGVPRGGAETAIVDVTIYTSIRPTERSVFSVGAKVGTVTDDTTPSLTFTLRGSAVIDPVNLDTFYNARLNRWEITLPAECDTPGSVGNAAGAGSIRKNVSGIQTPWQVVNGFSADYGYDIESNVHFASRIQDRTLVGVDTGTRKGLLVTARSTPGVVEARVVASGDSEMLRDWLPYPGKHIFGCADIYVRGRSFSQAEEVKPYAYTGTGTQGYPSSYVKLKVYNSSLYQFTVEANDLPRIKSDIIGVGEVFVDQGAGRTFYFGTKNATVFQAANGNWIITLDPNEVTYKLRTTPVNDRKPEDRLGANGLKIPNSVAFGAVSAATPAVAYLRLATGLSVVPEKQPVTRVFSISGETGSYLDKADLQVPYTGLLPAASYRLVQTSSPLLEGLSQKARDTVVVNNSLEVVTKTITFLEDGADTLELDEGMVVAINGDGVPTSLLSVVGEPQTGGNIVGLIPYTAGKDYVLKKTGRYGVYAIHRPEGSTIPLDREIVVSYNRYKLFERVVPVIDQEVTLTGTSAATLPHTGIILDAWTPWSHGHTLLSDDSDAYFEPVQGQAPTVFWSRRYLRVLVQKGDKLALAVEGRDYVLNVDADTGAASIARVAVTSSGNGNTSTTGTIINDGDTVKVSYYRLENFTFKTQYPSYVATVAERVEEVRHAAADILVKTMVGNSVDVTMTVELDPSASPEIVDPKIRTVIGMVMDRASDKLSQAEVIRQVKSIRGVKSVKVPLTRFAKTDGAYEIGTLIPSGTRWVQASTVFPSLGFNSHVFISYDPVLQFPTIPSGGLEDSSVSLTYEGETLKRAKDLSELASADVPMFYIIGIQDSYWNSQGGKTPIDYRHARKVVLVPKATITNPVGYPFRVTYQIFGEGGAQDLTLSPTEYVKPGNVLIEYIYGKMVK